MTFEEQNNYIYKMKQSFINGTLSNVPQKYAAIVRDWRESQRAGVDPTLKSLTESARDVHVFDRIDDLQKCHIAYFKDYYKSRHTALEELGCAIFYLDSELACYHKGGYRPLLDELKVKGIRVGTKFSVENIGVFAATNAIKNPFVNCFSIADAHYADLLRDYACIARYGEQVGGNDFHSVTLVFIPIKRYTKSVKDSVCFILEAEDFAYKNSFLYPHIERRFNLLEKSSQYSNDIFLLVDDNGDIAFFNNRFEVEFGRRITSGVGEKLKDYMPELAFTLKSLSSGREISMNEVMIPDKNGDNRFYYLDCVVIKEKQRNIGLKLTLKTATQLKKYSSQLSGQSAHFTFDSIIGESAEMRRQKRLGMKAAASMSNVLITGESGTGKEMFAQSIHNASARAAEPFVPINCGAIPKELIGTELFGYEGGAFTGASRSGSSGKLEQANGGTLFLDEIGEMPIDMQSFLLRFLEDGVITRIGGKKYIPLNVRIIAATNKALAKCVDEGTFRMDLYFRLNVQRLILPPLRDRMDDLELLVNHFITRLSRDYGKNITGVSPAVLRQMHCYRWPGNLRELRNVVERCIINASGSIITAEDFPADLQLDQTARALPAIDPTSAGGFAQLPNYKDFERDQIRALMIKYAGNKSLVAKALSISRGTLYKRLSEMNYDGE